MITLGKCSQIKIKMRIDSNCDWWGFQHQCGTCTWDKNEKCNPETFSNHAGWKHVLHFSIFVFLHFHSNTEISVNKYRSMALSFPHEISVNFIKVNSGKVNEIK